LFHPFVHSFFISSSISYLGYFFRFLLSLSLKFCILLLPVCGWRTLFIYISFSISSVSFFSFIKIFLMFAFFLIIFVLTFHFSITFSLLPSHSTVRFLTPSANCSDVLMPRRQNTTFWSNMTEWKLFHTQ
jgi:hypothetical protein